MYKYIYIYITVPNFISTVALNVNVIQIPHNRHVAVSHFTEPYTVRVFSEYPLSLKI